MNRSIAIVFVVFIAWPSAALGQPVGAQAEVLFRQSRDLLAAGKVAEVCSAFEESQKLEPAVTTLLNLAGCREKHGQLATAWGCSSTPRARPGRPPMARASSSTTSRRPARRSSSRTSPG